MKALAGLATVVMIVATSAQVVHTRTLGPVRRWFLHYGMSCAGGKHWRTPAYQFATLEDCVQFVEQGSWAKAEHCDGNRF